jgi:hypothetical protein
MDVWYRAQEQEAAQARAAAEDANRLVEEERALATAARAQQALFVLPSLALPAAWPATAVRELDAKTPLTPAGRKTKHMYFYDGFRCRCKVGDIVCWDLGYGDGRLYAVKGAASGDKCNPTILMEPLTGVGRHYAKVQYVRLVRRRGEAFDR